MIDWNRYVGIPWRQHGRDTQGCDCWGLVRLVYAEQLGLELPSYAGDYVDTQEREVLSRLIEDGRDAGPWREVEKASPGDVLLFRVGALTTHVGLAMSRGRMLHAHRDQSKVERIADPKWRDRYLGAWRHEGRA